MGLKITSHAYRRMDAHGILPGEADAVVADPDWETTRERGNIVYAKGGIAVVVNDGAILTAYRLVKGESDAPV